ncbi:MAG: FecR family protein [Myxococcota bacterium]
MSEPDELLERTLELALRAPVPNLDAEEARERARAALEASDDRLPQQRLWPWAAAAAAVLAVGAVAIGTRSASPSLALGEKDPAPKAEPAVPSETMATQEHVEAAEEEAMLASDVRLPSGDRLISSPGALYEVKSTSAHRRVDLLRGDVMFDIARRQDGSFTVHVGDTQVRVLGTVFSVQRQQDEVAVRVFEGRVEVRSPSDVRQLSAGELWTSDTALLTDAWTEAADRQWAEVEPTRRAPERAPRREPTEPASQEVSLADARALVLAGEFEAAENAANEALASTAPAGGWWMVKADAQRGRRQWRAAAESYDRAASALRGARVPQAAYAAARIYADRLSDPAAAHRSLQEGRAAAEGSPVEERARILEIRVLRSLGRDAGGATERYLTRFPHTPAARGLRP